MVRISQEQPHFSYKDQSVNVQENNRCSGLQIKADALIIGFMILPLRALE
jgi:hypothetical protein